MSDSVRDPAGVPDDAVASTMPHTPRATSPGGDTAAASGSSDTAVGVVVGAGEPAGHLAAGTRVGRYVIDRVVGVGGMSVVYAAHDPELGRTVAIKVLRALPGLGPRHAPRLQREAHALARVVHPHVVVVHDVGTVGGEVFLVQEYLDGGTLGAWQRSRRPWREVLELYRRAGRGLAAAHAAGLIHRDFKPDNVLLGSDGRLRVVDFGLVRTAGEVSDDTDPSTPSGPLEETLTQTGAVMGTPAYMAPEQHRGGAAVPASDQFAFCVALWEALHGEHPFGGADRAELAARAVTGEVREPSGGRTVPRWVRRPLLRGLRPEPAARHPSMVALLAELERDPARRRTRVLAIGGGAAIVAGAIAVASTRGGGRAPSPMAACQAGAHRIDALWSPTRMVALEAAFLATHRPFAADAARGVRANLDVWTAEYAAQHLDACAATHQRGDQSPELFDRRMGCLDAAERELRAFLGALTTADAAAVERAVDAARALRSPAACGDRDALLSAVGPPPPELADRVRAIRDGLAEVYATYELRPLADVKARLLPLVEQARTVGWLPVAAEAWQTLGIVLYHRNELTEAIAALEESTLAAEASRHDDEAAHSYRLLVEVLAAAEKPDQAQVQLRKAEAYVTRSGDDLDDVVALERVRVKAAESRGDYAQALVHARRALDLGQQLGDAGVRHDRINLAAALANSGALREAQPIFEAILEDERTTVGVHHRRYAEAAENLARGFYMTGRFDAAAPLLEQAIAVHHELGHEIEAAEDRTTLGMVLLELGRATEAEALYRRAISDLERLAPTSMALQQARGNLSNQLAMRGDFEAALPLAQAVVEGFRRKQPGHPMVAVALNNLASTYVLMGRIDDALTAALEGQQILAAAGGTRHAIYLDSTLGDAYAVAGRADEAEAAYRRSITSGERILGEDGAFLANPLAGLAQLLVDRGRHAAARPLAERALALLASSHDVDLIAAARFALAGALEPTDRAAARPLAEQARDTWRRTGARPLQLARVEAWLAGR